MKLKLHITKYNICNMLYTICWSLYAKNYKIGFIYFFSVTHLVFYSFINNNNFKKYKQQSKAKINDNVNKKTLLYFLVKTVI